MYWFIQMKLSAKVCAKLRQALLTAIHLSYYVAIVLSFALMVAPTVLVALQVPLQNPLASLVQGAFPLMLPAGVELTAMVFLAALPHLCPCSFKSRRHLCT